MSAAERLKALDEAMDTAIAPTPWHADWLVGDPLGGYSAGIFSPKYRIAVCDSNIADGLAALRNALPELIEVVRTLRRIHSRRG